MAQPPVIHEHLGLRYATHTEVYVPHDDTWLLVGAVQGGPSLRGKTVVEVGCGAGLGVIAALRHGAEHGIGVDLNLAAVRLANENAALNGVADRFEAVHGDLMDPVDLAEIDLVLFNPPYLPTAPEERLPGDLNLAFDGGATGNETILRFSDQLVAHEQRTGSVPDVLFVLSSLNDLRAVKTRLAAAGLSEVEERGWAKFDFERLGAHAFTAGIKDRS